MRPSRALRFVSAVLCLSAASAFAQYTVKRVTFSGATPYADADLQAASGLRTGLAFNKDDLQAAAQRLVDTGDFDDVQVALDGPMKAISVNFTLKPVSPDHLFKVSFANLIWWQPEELLTALHAKLPLFNGTLPEAGNQQDAAQTALQQLLTEKGVTATLNHVVIEPTLTEPYRLVEYRVTTPSIHLHSATISGASPAFAPAVDKLATAAVGFMYNEGLTNHSLTERILDVYRDAGNLDASLTQLHRTPQASSGGPINVDLTATVQEGHPYRVSGIEFTATPLMSSEDFAKTLKLHPEDTASRKGLLESLKPLNDAYHNQGYLDATIQAVPTLNPSTYHVAYTVSVIPGDQYHVRSINAVNLSPEQRKDFERGWTLKPGALYNESYVANFLTNNTALRTLENYSATYKASADPETHMVDITMTFIRGKNISGR